MSDGRDVPVAHAWLIRRAFDTAADDDMAWRLESDDVEF